MSDLIDRYLMAVSANLPKKDRADITAELRDILFSKAEARQAELGHPLSKAEEGELLHDFGHPLEVAGRYGKRQELIGPAVYPFYVFTLKVALGIIAAIYVALYAAFVVAGHEAPRPQDDIIDSLLVAFALVTLAFVVIERTGVIGKIARSWKPASLPMLGAPVRRSPFEVLFEAAVAVVVILWLTGVLRLPQPVPRNISLALGPIFETLHHPILALVAVQLGLDAFELVMPGLVKAHAATRIAFNVAVMALLVVLLQADHIVLVRVSSGKPGLQEMLQAGFDNGFHIGIAASMMVAVYEIWRAGRRLVRFERLRRVQTA